MPLATEVLDRSSTTLARALREMFKGEILSDPFTRSLYSTDASIYEMEPIFVAYPLDELDVRSCLWFAQKQGVAVIARGGGSNPSGAALGKAIIMDLSVHMNRIVELDKEHHTVTVQTGLVLDSLNRALAPYGYRVGPDPHNSNRGTIGGMIASNASGARSVKYGDTRKNLIAARVCLMDGTVTLANATKLSSQDYEDKKKEEGMSGKIHRELPEILKRAAAVIAAKKSKAERESCGYLLQDVVQGDVYDLPKLLCGSQGTLGVVTQAVLKVEPLEGTSGLAIIPFANVLDAAKAAPLVRQATAVSCQLLDEKLVEAGRRWKPEVAALLPQDGAILVVEFEAANESSLETQSDALKAKLSGAQPKLILDPKVQDDVRQFCTTAAPLLYRRDDRKQPSPFVEDAAVPVASLATYIEKAGKVFEKYKVEWAVYGDAGSGRAHLLPLLDLQTKEHCDALEKIAGEIHAIVWELSGTISASHGDGLARSQFIEKQLGKDALAVFKEIKELFDPSGLLNPNKKVTTDAKLMTKNLRFGANYEFSSGEKPKVWSIAKNQALNARMFKSQLAIRSEMTVEALAANPHELHHHGRSPLNWGGREMAQETAHCNGCAHCKTTGPEEDMCPRFKYERVEDASPRAKANILRRMMSGHQTQGTFNSDELIEIMDTCFNCKACHDGCPSHVNIPKIVLEAKARYHQSHGLSMDKWILTQCENIDRVGMLVPALTNMIAETAPLRWLAEKITGIDRRRPHPRLKTWSLRHRYTASANSDRPKVALYPDRHSKYNAPEVLQAAVDVLEHNGYEVYVPDAPCTNDAALMNGAVMEARKNATDVAKVLAPLAFKGIPILTLDATTCMSLQQDFLYYVDTPETRAVARHARDIGDFLRELQRAKKLNTKFQHVDAVLGYHQPCHHKSLHIGVPALELVGQIPGVKVLQINQGCCGNPGNWGFAKKNYDESMWIGKGLFAELGAAKNNIQYGLTECGSCKCQMEHGSGKQTLHPIQVLAAAYGYAGANPREDSWDKWDAPAVAKHDDHHDDHHDKPVVASEHYDEHAHVQEEHGHDDHSHGDHAHDHDHGHAEAH